MLVTLKEALGDAQKQGYAVGLFNTVNLEMAKAVISAAEESRSPVIVGSAEILLGHCDIPQLADILLPMIQKSPVPIVLHSDHGLTYDRVIQALRCGFSSVMYDCSGCSLEENLKNCREMASIAHAFGASIEAELGHVGSGAAGSKESAGGEDHSVYTQPDQAKEFVEYTKVDALAVAIGTAHGPYLKTPKLDLQRLEEIRRTIDTPLVLHGGSGLSDQDFRNCIERGIAKINIFTDIDQAGCRGARRAMEAGAACLTDLMPEITAEIQATVRHKMELFGSVGKA